MSHQAQDPAGSTPWNIWVKLGIGVTLASWALLIPIYLLQSPKAPAPPSTPPPSTSAPHKERNPTDPDKTEKKHHRQNSDAPQIDTTSNLYVITSVTVIDNKYRVGILNRSTSEKFILSETPDIDQARVVKLNYRQSLQETSAIIEIGQKQYLVQYDPALISSTPQQQSTLPASGNSGDYFDVKPDPQMVARVLAMPPEAKQKIGANISSRISQLDAESRKKAVNTITRIISTSSSSDRKGMTEILLTPSNSFTPEERLAIENASKP